MNEEKNVFTRLAERMGAKGSIYYPKILENQMTVEEGEILFALNDWMTAEKLAKKLNLDEKNLQARLDDLAKRRLVLGGKEGYAAPPNIRSLPRAQDSEKTRQLSKAFNTSGEYPKILVAGWENRLRARGFAAHKVILLLKSAASPELDQKHPVVRIWTDMKKAKAEVKTASGGRKLTPQVAAAARLGKPVITGEVAPVGNGIRIMSSCNLK
jgi:hypothetical protein